MKTLVLFLFPILTFAQTMPFQIEGHRGARGLLPENTIPSFKKAIDLGAHVIELDVVISKDKKVVVSHDTYFNPEITTAPNGEPVTKETQGNLYTMDYKEIKKYDVGLRGNKGFPEQEKMKTHKPLFKDMIREIEKYTKQKGLPPVKYNVEIKSNEKEIGKTQPDYPEFSDLVYNIIVKELPLERVNMQSFDYNILKYWNAQMQAGKYKKIELAVLIDPRANNDIQVNLDKLGFKPDIWSPYYTQVNTERVKQLHDLGIRVIPWTVNKREEMEKVKAVGCDGVITDYPDRAKGL
ncbi:glycerophosphodiester phosphodiesterase family protein [Emticicia agri]|uniref:Glycerophosphodiester phosphodiesterase n=1 Tax=Emticicia agri TaxID=2492393 RepID=A0A4Q5M2H9_9BACT|nr:glycerophosphodiester phosphodiesterase family protein [Emticicia agri]RYU96053.1 glycerophosphodiester phosphodiesterase [Emticicia agri]